jgi:WD40 repeat protein
MRQRLPGLLGLLILSAVPGLALDPPPSAAADEKEALPQGAAKRLGAVERPAQGRCGSVAFSPDGKTVVAVRHIDGTGHIFFWDVETGRELRVIKEANRRTMALVLSADAKGLVTESWDSTVVVWDLAAGVPFFKRGLDLDYRANSQPTLDFPFTLSPNGRLLACRHFKFHEQDKIALWETASGLSRGVLLAEDGGPHVRAGAISPDGRYLAGSRSRANPGDQNGYSTRPVLWDLATGRICREIEGCGAGAGVAGFAADGRVVAHLESGTCYDPIKRRFFPNTHPIKLSDARTGKTLTSIACDDAPNFLTISTDARLVAAASWGRPDVLVWDAGSGELVHTFKAPKGEGFGGLAYSPDGKYLATHGHETGVLLWDLEAVPALKKARAPTLPEAPPEPEPEKLTAEALHRLWDDLASDDGVPAFKAIWALALHPKQAVPLMRDQLRPLTAPTPAELARLFVDLAAEDFATREKAVAELSRVALTVAADLRRTAEQADSLDLRRRAGEIVKGLGPPVTLGPALRGIRAVEALEHIGTAEARTVLEAVAKGAPAGLETAEARLALDRLARRRPPR